MSKISTKPPSGTRDFLPDDIAKRHYVIGIIEDVYQRYGFVPLETPAFENLKTLTGKYGEEGDQLLYRLLHRRDALKRALEKEGVEQADLADLGLRYDLTVPLSRVVAQYPTLPKFFKRYQIQPVWRADRPGRGRFREFYQCDVDIVGANGFIADAEVLSAIAEVLINLGFSDFTLHLNHRKLLRGLIEDAGIDIALEQSALIAVDKLDKIGVDGVKKELAERGIAEHSSEMLLSLIKKNDDFDNKKILAHFKSTLKSEQGLAAIAELEELLSLLEATPAGPHIRISPDLARGLSYYTGPIFEISVKDLAGSLGGGGRYDQLIGMFSKNDIPAIGCSLGLERILLVLEERKLYPDLHQGSDVLVAWFGIDPKAALGFSNQLRKEGLRVETYPTSTKLGKQLQYADSDGVKARVVAILGEDEVNQGTVSLKHLASGEQKQVSQDEAADTIKTWL